MRPIDVTKENENTVYKNLYGLKTRDGKKVSFKYHVGDLVRVSKVRGSFAKGYEQNYTHEYFTIAECIQRNPVVYRLKDYDGEVLDGTFYEEELQKIRIGVDKAFKIEKILEQKRKGKKLMFYVTWVGWPPKFNTWIPAEDIIDV